MAFCPNCRSEYREGAEVCRACGAALVGALPPLPQRGASPVSTIRQFLTRFSGRDTTPPRLQSFLLEQPPDWRHIALAFVLVVAMTQAGIGKTSYLRAIFAPATTGPEEAAWRAGIVPEMQRLSPLVIAGVLLGSAALGLAGGLVARKRQWLWGPAGLCVGIAMEFLWLRLYYAYGRTVPSITHHGMFVRWRFHLSPHGLPLVACALACAAAGGTLANTRLRRWSIGTVTVCVAMSAIGAFWSMTTLVTVAVGHPYWSSRVAEPTRLVLQNVPYLLAGAWGGWAMRRWGIVWGTAVGLLPLYVSVTRWSGFGPFQPLWSKLLGPVFFIEWARTEGLLDALAFLGPRADYRTLAAALGGLVGWYLWQRRARQSAHQEPAAEVATTV